LAISASVFFDRAWFAVLANRIPPFLSPGLVNLSHDVVQAILHTVMVGITGSGIIMIVLGLGMWIGSGFIKTMNESGPALAPNTPAG
jgi:hypothetical protein